LNESLFFNGYVEKWQDNLKAIDEIGGPKHYNHFPAAWAHAMDTPFQWTKQVASHFGGTRNPMIVSWPARIKAGGGLRSQFVHVIDIVPTLYELIGITPPLEMNGVPQKPMEGISFAYTLDAADARERHTTQYFEMGANRGMYHDGWMASALAFVPWDPKPGAFDPDTQKWELYDTTKDFSQANDVAAAKPQRLRDLQDQWWAEAAKYSVLPLDWRKTERFNSELMGRPTLAGNAKQLVYYPGTVALPPEASPRILNRSWTITANLEIPAAGAEGMIVTAGGIEGGYGLYVRGSKPTFVYNYLALDRTTIMSDKALPSGKVQLKVDCAYQGGPKEVGKPADITISVNGAKVAEGHLTRTVPAMLSLGEGMDVGEDTGSAVDFTYKLPFRFTGTIDKVTFGLK